MPEKFERIIDGKRGKRAIIAIDDAEVRRLLTGRVRDVEKSIELLRANPWAVTRTTEADIRYNPNA